MMKKVLVFVLMLALLFAFAGCKKEEESDEKREMSEAERLLTAASEKIDELVDSAEAIFQQDFRAVSGTQSFSMVIGGNMVLVDDGTEKGRARVEMFGKLNGQTIFSGDMYMEGDWIYYSVGDENYKTKNDEDSMTQLSEDTSGMLPRLPSKYYETAEIETEGSRTTITVSVPSNEANTLFAELLEDLDFYMIGDSAAEHRTVDSASVVYFISDGYLIGCTTSVEVAYDYYGASLDASASVAMEIFNLNGEVTVEPIPGCYDFEESEEDGGIF